MSSYVPFLVIGIVVGSVYGIAAMGLVLTYKTSGVLNVGHGAVAAAAAVVFHQLRQEHGLAWPLAAAISVLGFGIIAGLLMEQLARCLASAPTGAKLVATVGLVVAIPALAALLYGPSARTFEPLLTPHTAFTLSGVHVTTENVVVVVFGLSSAIALYLFFSRSRLGRGMRGVVDDPALLSLTGVGPARVRRFSWLIGCSFAAVSGILLASAQQQLDVTLLSLLVVQAFGAAAIGAFTSLPLAYAGGLAVGVLQALLSKSAVHHTWMHGLDVNTPFLVLFAVLLVLPRHKLAELGGKVRPKPRGNRATPRAQGLGWAVIAVAALAAPSYWGVHGTSYTVAATQVLLFLSLVLLVRVSGQISLCQVGFAAIGGAAVGRLLDHGLPWGLAVLVAALIAVPVGAVVAIPAIRLSGLFLALATLGFGIFIAQFFYVKSYMFGFADLHTGRPHVLRMDTDKGYYYVLLAFAVAGIAMVVVVEKSRLGRLLRGLADSPTALQTLGASADVTRVLVFCLSAFLAGISGALFAGQFGSVSGTSFNFVGSLVILAVLAIAGRTTVKAAIIGPLFLIVGPAYAPSASDGFQVLFGAGAMIAAICASGVLNTVFGRLGALVAWRAESTTTARAEAAAAVHPRAVPAASALR
jgi:branched-subunit amino acid ABC-type transport system permease component